MAAAGQAGDLVVEVRRYLVPGCRGNGRRGLEEPACISVGGRAAVQGPRRK